MRWVFVLALLCHLLTPAPTWAQTATPTYNANDERSVGAAVALSLQQSLRRRIIDENKQASTLETVRQYLALPAFSGGSWLAIAKALGVPVGTTLGAIADKQFCTTNPTAIACSMLMGGSDGGAGAGDGGNWAALQCDLASFNFDFAGNVIATAINIPNPKKYSFGQTLWYGGGSPNLVTNEFFTAMKVYLHQTNGLVSDSKKLAPMFFAGTLSSPQLFVSAPAYYEGQTLKPAPAEFRSATKDVVAWAQNQNYGTPPPTTYTCDSGIGFGDYNQHYLTCLEMPMGWSIPAMGVIPPAYVGQWANNAPMASCTLSKEFIRQLADLAYKNACTASPASCAPYQRVEPEDVRTGGKDPTVREVASTTDKTLPTTNTPTTPTTEPTTTPTTTPTTGPDWTDPGTAAPNPTSPTAQSIVDKAFDWGFPAISINIPSGTCPTYSADFFGHQLVLDSHCPFIETNRALISAMMLLLFTIAAGIIVLRA